MKIFNYLVFVFDEKKKYDRVRNSLLAFRNLMKRLSEIF